MVGLYLGCEYCSHTILDRFYPDDLKGHVFPVTREMVQSGADYASVWVDHSADPNYWKGVRDALITVLGYVTEVRMTGPGQNNAAYAILQSGYGKVQ
jgi:hypothetical protein